MSSNTKANRDVKIDLSIVIPALNEERRIGKTLDELSKFLKLDKTLRKLSCEVIVVSANGEDNTHDVAKKHGEKLPNFRLLLPGKRIGKGRDVRYGMMRAKGEYALFMDADTATPLHHIPEFYKEARTEYDIVIATRNLKKHHTQLPRRLLSNLGNIAFRLLGGVWIEDSQCGFKLFSRTAIKICFKRQTIEKWGFDMELLTIAKTHRLKVKHVRVDDWLHVEGGTFDTSDTFKNALETLRDLFSIAINRIKGTYRH